MGQWMGQWIGQWMGQWNGTVKWDSEMGQWNGTVNWLTYWLTNESMKYKIYSWMNLITFSLNIYFPRPQRESNKIKYRIGWMTFMTCEIKQREKPLDILYKKILKDPAGESAREYGCKNWALREKYARKIYRGKLPANI
jgi:hypothetical protein